MTVGFILLLIGGFILVIGAKGTYKFLPPFVNTPGPTIPKEPVVPQTPDISSQIPASHITVF